MYPATREKFPGQTSWMERRKRIPSLAGPLEEVYLSKVLKLLVFDLDGTLADTSHDLAVSVNHALSRAGHSPLPLGTVVGFLGDGARTLITRSLMASGNGETSG